MRPTDPWRRQSADRASRTPQDATVVDDAAKPAQADPGHVRRRALAEILDEIVEETARLALGVVPVVADEDRACHLSP